MIKLKIPFFSNKNTKAKEYVTQVLLSKNDKRRAVIKLSDELSGYLGEVNRDVKVFNKLKRYDIMSVDRAYHELGNGWVELWEIVPKGYGELGYVNKSNPSWIEIGGTGTINLPPNDVIEDVINQLQNLK